MCVCERLTGTRTGDLFLPYIYIYNTVAVMVNYFIT